MARRDYEHDLPEDLDLEGKDKDYSVLLAEADKVRADAAISLQKYRLQRESEQRAKAINAGFRAALCG